MNMILMTLFAAGVIGGLDQNIVTPEWLQQNIHNPQVVVVEIGSSPTVDHPHIPGARFVPIESIVKQGGWPPDELPPFEDLRRAFDNAGVGDKGRIILYSANPLWATRAWFTLDYLGQGDRTAILDGGFNRWKAEKRPIATKRMPHLPKTFVPFPDRRRLATLDDVRNAAQTGVILIDARPAHQFHGLRRGADVARRGHVPGAACQPWASNYADDGSFLPAAELRARYEKLLGGDKARVIVYGRTGMDATVPYFVLRSLGYDVTLYDGSYTEWSRDPSLPVAKLSDKP